jgi:hypothetical protein
VRSYDLRTSEEVFRMFCLRVARDEHPSDPDGLSFEAVCAGAEAPASTSGSAGRPGSYQPSPRLNALLARRTTLVAALDRVFAQGAGQSDDAGRFVSGELTKFLASLIPLYDDQTLPKSTRALGSVAGKLLDPQEPRGQTVLETLARLSARGGYRSPRDVLALVRPSLAYPRLDALSQQLLAFVGEGGPAHETFLGLLDALTLELAEPAEPVSEAAADKTTLHAAAGLLLAEHESYANAGDPAAYYVRRDLNGNALAAGSLPDPVPTPFPRAAIPDSAQRTDDGRARAATANDLAFRYGDANRTLLAALMRDQKTLLERKDPNQLSTVEKLLRGLPVILGARGNRAQSFMIRAADSAKMTQQISGNYMFSGPDVEHSPLLDLVHGLAQLLRYPETDRLLALLFELLDKHESDAAAPVYAGLAIDRRADNHPSAQLIGVDGKPSSAQEFWDDFIEVGMRMAARPGLFRDAIEALSTDEGAAQARLMARFMKFRDDVGYNGAPLSLGGDGRYADNAAELMSQTIEHDFGDSVRRMPGADVGLNRSLFQRLISTIHATHRVANCNKEGAKLSAADPLTGTPLTFPNPTARDTGCNGDVLCDATRVGAYAAIDLVCPQPSGASSDTFKRCEFVEQPNGAETHMRAILGKSEVKLKSAQLMCLADAGLAGDLGATQESSSQIATFTLKPTAQAIARFMYVPRNTWLSDLFDPMPTLHGQPLVDYEPNLLFALEVKDKETLANGSPLSFLEASRGLLEAFDQHEQFDDTPNGQVARGGYLFADLLSVLHMHWDSRQQGDCPRSNSDPACVALGLSGNACSAGCSQSRDPTRPFYAKQTDLVSYEPLLIEAFSDERLADLLALSSRTLASMRIDGEDGVTRDGLTILGDFLERILKPDPTLTAFSNKQRSYVTTNTCLGEQFDPNTKQGTCDCPPGTHAKDANDARSLCIADDGRLIPRGRVLPQATPLHLVLDALNRFDAAFQSAGNQERLPLWREARSALVDLFLNVTKTPDPTAPADALKATYRMENPRARRTGMALLSFARERIKLYRDADSADDAALDTWALGLADRLASVLGHPITARVLDLFEALWSARQADGPAHELSRFNAYLLDPANLQTFADVALAAADGIELLDRDRALTPAIQFAALTLAEDAFSSLDSLASSPKEPSSELGSAACSLEVSRRVSELNRGNPAPSTLSKLLKNAVLPLPTLGGQSALEVIFDAIADVNRADPSVSTTVPHSSQDNRAAFTQLRGFLIDQERGLERLYKVIANRRVQ